MAAVKQWHPATIFPVNGYVRAFREKKLGWGNGLRIRRAAEIAEPAHIASDDLFEKLPPLEHEIPRWQQICL
jgi:hypothetical protein